MTRFSFPQPALSSLSSDKLERYVAALFQSHGYFVNRNLWWSEAQVSNTSHTIDILQVDVLAYSFSPFTESKILIECKGGGTFTDLFKFSGIAKLIRPNSAFFVANNSPSFDEINKIGNDQRIIVLRPNDVISKFSIQGQEQQINRWYWSNEIQDLLQDKERLKSCLGVTSFTEKQKEAYSEIKKYNSLISNRIWTIADPRDQANYISNHLISNKAFIANILKIQGLPRKDAENAIAENILCESAASVILRAKIEYLLAAVRCAIAALISTDSNYLISIVDSNFKTVVQKMIDSIKISCRLPQFIQFWIYLFGGLINTNGSEITQLAKLIHEREEDILEFLTFLGEIFSILTPIGPISWSMDFRSGIYEFKAVPDSLRGYGICFRELNFIDVNPFVFKLQWLRRLQEITGY